MAQRCDIGRHAFPLADCAAARRAEGFTRGVDGSDLGAPMSCPLWCFLERAESLKHKSGQLLFFGKKDSNVTRVAGGVSTSIYLSGSQPKGEDCNSAISSTASLPLACAVGGAVLGAAAASILDERRD